MIDPIDRARQIQSKAADPGRSVVLEAAAGAGKTKVLVDRYLRLCLGGAGVDLDPRAILAITFTRKATMEIQERLQQQARQLVSLPVGKRLALLAGLLDRQPQAPEAARAAWFHETLLDDPVGLCIETMHAFCQRILGRFAAEAGLDPRFAVLDEQQERAYRAEALDRLELELARHPQAAAAQAQLAGTAAGARARLAGLFDRRVYLQRWLDRVCPPAQGAAAALSRPLLPCLDALLADLQTAMLRGTPLQGAARSAGAAHPVGTAIVEPALMTPWFIEALQRLMDEGLPLVAAADGGADLTSGLEDQLARWRQVSQAAIASLAADPAGIRAVSASIQKALLTASGQLRTVNGRKQTKAERQTAFATAAAPVLRAIQQIALLDLLQDNRTLLSHGLRALDIYAALKRRDRVVDFQDLEVLALRLLTDPCTGPQVHFRLDARLDHLLLDEFQDTNHNQWDILQPLLAEILAGGEALRTVMIVGDVKQSIYGFRGADPTVFGAARELVRRQVGDEAVQQLPTNFRSLRAIVQAVGELCQQDPLAGHLGEAAPGARQDIARAGAGAGAVVCVHPFERLGDQSGHERAAASVVRLIQRLLKDKVQTWHEDPVTRMEVARDMRLEDCLVLTRSKTRLAIYEAAMRKAGIPFTPAGRGLLARCREVQDMLALLRWLTYPADDAAGAVVLRSPLCRLSEVQVQSLLAMRLAGQSGMRRRTLQDVLQAWAPTGRYLKADLPRTPASKASSASAEALSSAIEDLPPQVVRLLSWFRLAGRLPLHDLMRRLYREGEVLERFEIAHGEQARFNLLRLLDLALAAEVRGGSLRDFVDELEQAALLGGHEEGAMPAEAGTGRVRFMTVHGAKGLQAPVVILADASTPLRMTTEDLLLAGDMTSGLADEQDGEPTNVLDAGLCDGPWIHGVRKEHYEGPRLPGGGCLPGPLAHYRQQAVNRLLAEEAHILYVAMTRARDRLYVLGGVNDRQSAEQTERSYLGWLTRACAMSADAVIDWRDPEAFLSDPLPAASHGMDTVEPDAVPPGGSEQPDAGNRGASGEEVHRRAAVAVSRLVRWTPPPLTPRFQIERPSQLDADRASSAQRAMDMGYQSGQDDLRDASSAAMSRRRDNPATRRGARIHAWLERACLLGCLPGSPSAGPELAAWDEVSAVWNDPALAWVFAADTESNLGLSEVPILHRFPGHGAERRRYGIIDRLIIRPDRVDIIDYKTSRIQPDQIEDAAAVYRLQLYAYREALLGLYPGRTLRCWLLWTAPAMAARRLTEVL